MNIWPLSTEQRQEVGGREAGRELSQVRPVSMQQAPTADQADDRSRYDILNIPQKEFYFKRIFHCLTSEVRSCFFLFVLHYHGEFFKGCGKTQFPCTHTCTWQAHSEHLPCQARWTRTSALSPGSLHSNKERGLQKPRSRAGWPT